MQLKDWKKAVGAFKKGQLDVLELRLDAFSDKNLSQLHKLVSLQKKLPPILLTVRSRKEGGLKRLSLHERKARFKLFMPFADFLDCEIDSSHLLRWLHQEAKTYGKKLILSYHDFNKTPSLARLESILRKSLRYKPFATKFAVRAKGQEDLIPLFSFLSRNKGKRLIVIGMGKAGELSRILFPVLGSQIAFGHLGRKTAPGQLSVHELRRKLKKVL